MAALESIVSRALTVFSFLCLVSANTDAEPPGRATPVYTPQPRYPAAAYQHGLGGSGILECNLRPDGTVVSVTVVRTTGYGILDKAAISAFQQWRFKPGTSKTVRIPVNFKMGLRSRMAGAALERPY